MFEQHATLSTVDLKRIAQLLQGEQIFELIARYNVVAELSIVSDSLKHRNLLSEDDIRFAQAVQTDSAYLADQAMNAWSNLGASQYVEEYTNQIAHEYTK